MYQVFSRSRLVLGLVTVLTAATGAEAVNSKFALKAIKFTRNNVTTTLNPPQAKFAAQPGNQIEAEIFLSMIRKEVKMLRDFISPPKDEPTSPPANSEGTEVRFSQ